MAKADLTPQLVRHLLHYDPDTGAFTRTAVLNADGRPSDHAVRYVGKPAGTLMKIGYVAICVGGVLCLAHRLAWLYVHGEWPKELIDHINGDRADNRIANLRCVSRSVNGQNQKRAHRDSAHGMLGVSLMPDRNKPWAAHICIDRKARTIGYFTTKEEAHAAYLEAKRRLHEGCTI